MTRAEIEAIQRKIKACMKNRLPVNYNGAEYIVSAMLLRYDEEDGFFYTVELIDRKRLNSSISVGLADVDWIND